MDLTDLAKLGVPTLLALAILGLIYILNRKYRETPNGDRRKAPHVISCPNRMQGLDATLQGLLTNLDTSTKILVELLRSMEEARGELRAVSDVTKLYQSGSRSEKIREESRDLLKELLLVARRTGGADGR